MAAVVGEDEASEELDVSKAGKAVDGNERGTRDNKVGGKREAAA